MVYGDVTMSSSARQSPPKRNAAAAAPKMASYVVFTGIDGHILLGTDAWQKQKNFT